MFVSRSFQVVATLCRKTYASQLTISVRRISLSAVRNSTKMDRSSSTIASPLEHANMQNVAIRTSGSPLGTINVTRVNDIVKSEEDNRDYRGLVLQNGMKVLLVSDPTTDSSAASLAVEVGHMSDPDAVPGLAHFCEHMLFLGTEKYPDENDYSTYLTQNGGSSNAATYATLTKYYFEVNPDKFDGALDRFAQFFIAPLFTESATERELNAVDSEHEKNIAIDGWRLSQLSKHQADPKHPFSKFGTGNKQTLKNDPENNNINVRDELIKFYTKWYSANIMSLAVFGKESLDQLEEMVLTKFSKVENKNVELPLWDPQPYKPEQYATKTYVIPVKDVRSLTLTFITKNLYEFYKSGPGDYVSHLLGHEGEGSILSALRKRGWCNTLMSSHSNTSRAFGVFHVVVDLTQEGLEHTDEITQLIFQYINLLKKNGPVEWIFDEIRNLNNLIFRFKDKENPMSFVSNVVHSMQIYPLNEVLSAPHLISEWRPDLINELLNELAPEKCRITIVSKKFVKIVNETEPWYKTRYFSEKIPQSVLKQWEEANVIDELHLPKPNPFIPTNFDLLPETSEITKHPTIIYDSPCLRVWHKQDNVYKRPKNCMNFDFSNPIAYSDPLNCNLAHLLLTIFKDNLKEYLYDAELAGLHLGVTNTTFGVNITISGYSEKQKVFLEKVLDSLFNLKIDKQRFEILKESYYRTLKNFQAEQPYQHAIYYLALILTEQAWSRAELLEAMKLVTVEALENFVKEFFSRVNAECFIYGNINRTEALQMSEVVKVKLEKTNSMILPLLSRQLLQKREYKLNDGDSYLFESKNEFHTNSCVELYLQCGAQTETSSVFIDLLAQILTEPCYNMLRTQEQLGYIVFCGSRKVNGATGLRIIVQSARDTTYVEGRIENFLNSMLAKIEEMSDEEFQRHKEGLASQKLEKPKKLSVMFANYLHEISRSQYHFDRAEAEVAILRKITKEELINYYKNYVTYEAPTRHTLAVHIISSANASADNVLTDITTCKKSSEKEYDTETATFANEISTTPPHSLQNESQPPPAVSRHTKIVDLSSFKSSKELYPIPRPFLDIRPKGAKSKL